MSETIELTGEVEDVFGHRFTLKAADGKHLVDLGPHAEGLEALRAGESVAVKGERKPSEVKANAIRFGDGEWRSAGKDAKPGKSDAKAGHDDDDDDHDHNPVTDEQVAQALADGGYTDAGEPKRKRKHVEVEAAKDGARHTVHIHKGGVVKKAEPVE